MARILFQDRWFEELASAGSYEASFEAVILGQAAKLWPGFWAVQFKSTVHSADGNAKADFALIERDYREWWVGEVEMGNHPLDAHVLPQVKVLAQASYGKAEAARLAGQHAGLDLARVSDMLRGRQPRVLVVVNAQRPDWVKALKRYDAWLAVLEVFRSDRNEYLFRVNGKHPSGPMEVVTVCRFDPYLPRWLAVESPAGLGGGQGVRIAISYHDQLTEWVRVETADKVWIRTDGPNPLTPDHDYEVLRGQDGKLLLRDIQKRRR